MGLAPGLYLMVPPQVADINLSKFQTTLAWLPVENQTQAGRWQYLIEIRPKPVKPQPPKPNSNNGGAVWCHSKPSEDPNLSLPKIAKGHGRATATRLT